MPKSPQTAAAIGGSADDIEAAFYDALQRADLEALMACWADEDEVVCVHPGGPRLVGGGAIRAAFEAMFASGNVRARPERVRKVETLVSAVHSLLERIEVLTHEGPREAWVVATNVYQKTAQGWRMVAHHASPGSPHELADPNERPAVLH